MAEWLKVLDVARLTGYDRSGVTYLIRNGVILPEHVRYVKQGRFRWYEISADALPLIAEHREQTHNRQVAPVDTQYVADPNGEYLGFELTPDEAARLKTVRELHRQYPSCKERYPVMIRMLSDG